MPEILIEQVRLYSRGQWVGEIVLPDHQFKSPLLIYEWQGGHRAIHRSCPHKEYDLVGCPISRGGVVICPWHGLPVSVVDPKTSFHVIQRDEQFFLQLT